MGSAIFSGLKGFPDRKDSTTVIISSKASMESSQLDTGSAERGSTGEVTEAAANVCSNDVCSKDVCSNDVLTYVVLTNVAPPPRPLELEEKAAGRPTLEGSHLSKERAPPHLGQAVRPTWDYIRNNNLQNHLNRKMIIPDQTLAAIIRAEEIHCFLMMRNLTP